ncbi:MAG: chemotaxis protein [Chloroflexia bacterium]|nr:chemotaxis protein [Chloroflexia bacterium]
MISTVGLLTYLNMDSLRKAWEQLRITSRKVQERGDRERRQREQLQRTVQEYVGYMQRVAQGDLAARLALEALPKNAEDPLIALGHCLNETVSSLQYMIARIHDAAAEMALATAAILDVTVAQVNGASEQSTAVAQASSTIEEIRSTTEQTAQRARSVADLAQHTAQVAQAGQQSVEETIQGIERIRAQYEFIVDDIQDLSQRTEAIGSIVSTVGDLASQSNLLALNAAVEAARAGEAGRGFAVVAQEVRNLAGQSQSATGRIREILLEIQQKVQSAVKVTGTGMQGMDMGVHLSIESGAAIRELSASVASSAEAALQIAAAAEQQRQAMEQITKAMDHILQVSGQSVANAQEVEQAIETLNQLAERLRALVGQYQL